MYEHSEGSIIGLGNPLLDISTTVTPDFLQKYDMSPNNVILASEKQENLPKDLTENFDVDYIAGGAVQNSMRVAQWFFRQKRVATFMGAVGVDKFADQMRTKATEDGVNVSYQVIADTPTGTCACLISDNGKHRSLCAFLGASQKFTIDYVQQNWQLVEQAKLVYVSGFYLIVSIDTAMLLAEHCLADSSKTFVLNLSAPYISQFYTPLVMRILPYVELLFGNETEAAAFAEVNGWGVSMNIEDCDHCSNMCSLYTLQDIKPAEIAQRIADMEHKTASRTVVITQGLGDVLVAVTGAKIPLRSYQVEPLPDNEIVDTNSAGDAFVGGYLALLHQGADVDECVKAGIYAAQAIIKRNGCSIPEKNIYRDI